MRLELASKHILSKLDRQFRNQNRAAADYYKIAGKCLLQGNRRNTKEYCPCEKNVIDIIKDKIPAKGETK